ncbi:T-cell surface glycoprotein CD8 alpha chain-like [Macrotis lagotis]|uniref:T-cell surface glycoprotein CD8 alpha chain-like n=1 Tax=Macrotis lagotis TaxID=92651 RepID=UPI003D690C4D
MGSPAAVRSLLLPLVLLLQPAGSQQQLQKFRMTPPEKRDARPAETVQLSCETLGVSQTGCSWLRLVPGARVPTFLLFISGSTGNVKVADGLNDGRLQGARASGTVYTLTLKDFRAQDQGHYYCLLARNAALFFSPSVAVFLPVKATTTPAPKTTTPLAFTNSSIQIPAGSERCKNSRPQGNKGLDFSCDFYIWMPLTSICVVLLLALITTIIICYRSRKRVCRCPRPLIRPGGKSGPSPGTYA